MSNNTSSSLSSQFGASAIISDLLVIKRNGNVVPFHPSKIEHALKSAFLAVLGAEIGNSRLTRDKISALRDEAITVLEGRRLSSGTRAISIEEIQDVVEDSLMRSGEQKVARAYVLYRDRKNEERKAQGSKEVAEIVVVDESGKTVPLPRKEIAELVIAAGKGLHGVDSNRVIELAIGNLYNGAPIGLVHEALLLAARGLIEEEPAYDKVTARLLLNNIRTEVLGHPASQSDMATLYSQNFSAYISRGIIAELLDPALGTFDLKVLGKALDASRDFQFGYLGLQTLYDRYFLHIRDVRIELPQFFFMRVAMGLAIREKDRETRAIEFYNILSSFDFMSSTPTLFNAGTLRSQLSSCYLSTVADDLAGIYDAIKDNALLSKFAGGLGNDWTPVRSLGAHIKGTNGKSQGVVPFLKVVNDTAVAVNQGGKRKGAVCAYLETWHMDIEEFLDLRKNTGDDRRRTHDMNTANWIPDMFMKRVMEKGDWTLFSPSETPDLHDKVGKAFETAYLGYEAKATAGEMRVFKKVAALDLWRKMLSMLFETGHPWITFKDPCNIRSPQQHVGVVHSSNLCTEITLNTSSDEIAVCNLGSINMPAHMKDGKLDEIKLQKTIRTAMRMLDNVIDINFYPVEKARNSNMKHRPVGLGIMGYQDCLHMMRIPFSSNAAVQFADTSMEMVCYYAYLASTELAEERGRYESYAGSLWDKGILPQDTIEMLAKERGGYLEQDRSETMDWSVVRNRIKQHGMRNSNCVAIAPTATISNIIGVEPCIEPTFQNLFVKSNLSGEFTVVNERLVDELKALKIWDTVMIADLKHFDGTLDQIDRIPQEIRDLYATAFQIEPKWLIEAASRRQKWIDQAQSLNIYMQGASGKKLDETYKLAWIRGLKTTYYLRTIAATHQEKSTGRAGQLNAVNADGMTVAKPAEPTAAVIADVKNDADGEACYLRPGDDGFSECESCQ